MFIRKYFNYKQKHDNIEKQFQVIIIYEYVPYKD